MTVNQVVSEERTKEHPLKKYLRAGSLPHFFCSGCGSAQVLNFFLKAADDLQLDFDQLVAIGGVGCTARVPVYIQAESMHGVHGRTLPWATGIKLHKPHLKVVIFSGDGDAAAIGGNHLIQAARRNLDVVMIVANNLNFAMTGGQVAPTTLPHVRTTTTPFGNSEPRFDLCKLVAAAGGTFVARTTTYRPVAAINAIKKALNHKGFSFVEIITQCPTNYGRRAIGTDVPAETVQWISDQSVPLQKADQYSQEEIEAKFVLGTFADEERPIFVGSSYLYPEEQA
jgi:2-oxoglutarate ferredoxin oxidoreductase subunit beta